MRYIYNSMSKSLLFLPDISGFTEFIQNTEVEHSQHVISELLETLINANSIDLQLAEIEGDALFFYLEEEIPTMEALLNQVQNMFTAFYSHLKLLEKNRICPCNACASAPNLRLKIIAHCGEIQFINVQDKRKPFGGPVIEAHRLMKNSVESDNYVLFSQPLSAMIGLQNNYKSTWLDFLTGADTYDNKELPYLYSVIKIDKLKLRPFSQALNIPQIGDPKITIQKKFPVNADTLLEIITNYKYRHLWSEGVDEIIYDETQVTRLGSKHFCVINGHHLDFTTITKDGKPGQYVYGEMTTSPPPVDTLFQYFIISKMGPSECMLDVEIYWIAKSPLKKLALILIVQRAIQKSINKAIDALHSYVSQSVK